MLIYAVVVDAISKKQQVISKNVKRVYVLSYPPRAASGMAAESGAASEAIAELG